MSLSADGSKVIYKLKRKFRDGSTHVVLEPLDLIARLAALVPRPRVNLVTYHAVLAPAASLRDRIVPAPPDPKPAAPRACNRSPDSAEPDPPPQPTQPRRYSWAELMRRVYLVDVLRCPHCGGERKVLAFLTDPNVIAKILAHLGLPTQSPHVAPARAPPQSELHFD